MSKDAKSRPGRCGRAGKPAIKVKPYSYQPSKAELEADVSLPNTTPEELARRLRNVKFVETEDADTT